MSIDIHSEASRITAAIRMAMCNTGAFEAPEDDATMIERLLGEHLASYSPPIAERIERLIHIRLASAGGAV